MVVKEKRKKNLIRRYEFTLFAALKISHKVNLPVYMS